MSVARTRVLLSALLALLVLAMVACGGDDPAQEALDEVSDITDDADLDDVDVADIMGGEIPDDFPDDIPLPAEHEVTSAIGNSEAGFTVSLRVPGSQAAEVADELGGAFTSEGWTVEERSGAGGPVVAVKGDREVQAQVVDREGEAAVTYFTGPPPS